jgi:NAD kinase
MPKHTQRKGRMTSAIFVGLLSVFLVFGVASSGVAGATDQQDEGTTTASPSPSVTTTTPAPAPSEQGSASETATTSPDGEAGATHTESDAIDGEHSGDEDGMSSVHAGIHATVSTDVETVLAAGEDVSFTFQVNTSTARLEITALSDDVFGTLAGDADCEVGTVLPAGASCSFTLVKHLSGTAGSHVVDVFAATGTVAGKVVSDVGSVVCLFVSSEQQTHAGIHVTKTADVDTVAATGGDVTFTFSVKNTSDTELEITTLSDDVFGTLAGDADCEVGTKLDPDASCSFTLTEHLSGAAGTHHVDVFTVTGEVGGEVVTDTASETVLFVSAGGGTNAGIHVTKTADVDNVVTTGGDVTFTFTVQNTSNASLEITALSDDVFGTLTGDADCEVGTMLSVGSDCTFTLTKHLSGTAGTHHVDIFTATGEVNGQVVTDIASETVLFVSAEQETTRGIEVTKTANADSVVATGGDVTFTFMIENTSNAQLEITAMSDDVFGTLAGDADCQVGTMLPVGGSCSFVVTKHLSGTVGGHHINAVTATGEVNGNVVTDIASETVLFVSASAGGTGGGGGNGTGGQGSGSGTNVLGAQVTRAPGSAANRSGLAFTGSTALILAAAALGLFALGMTVLTVGRRLGRARG